jgi:hypothetical protein
MLHESALEEEFFGSLFEFDERMADEVARSGCPLCGGPLHRSDYERKPRGGAIAEAGEAFTLRHSLCCGRQGCRKRALPPSLRFLGRRVYLESVVLLASVEALVATTMRAARVATGVPIRTLRRWGTWWRDVFPKLDAWTVMRARFAPPPPSETELPKSLCERLARELGVARRTSDVLALAARLLSPVTTGSLPDASRFVRAALVR